MRAGGRLRVMVWGGDHCSPGYLVLRSQRGSQRHPPRPDRPGQCRLHPCPGCTTQPAGPQLLSSSAGPCNLGSPAASLLHPLFRALAEATHHTMGSPAPQTGHPHLHLHLPAREEDRGPAPHSTASVPQGWGQPHFLQAQDGVCGPGSSGPALHLPLCPIILPHWPGLALGGGSR